jgi:hypothetical protein
MRRRTALAFLVIMQLVPVLGIAAKAAYDELSRMFTHLSAVYANQGS